MLAYPEDEAGKALAGFAAILTGVWLISHIVGCNRSEPPEPPVQADAGFTQSVEKKIEELYSKYRMFHGDDNAYVDNGLLLFEELWGFMRDDAKAPVVARELAERFSREPVFVYPDYIALRRRFELLVIHAPPDDRITIIDALVTKMDNRDRIVKFVDGWGEEDIRLLAEDIGLLAMENLWKMLRHETVRVSDAQKPNSKRWRAFRQWYDTNRLSLKWNGELGRFE